MNQLKLIMSSLVAVTFAQSPASPAEGAEPVRIAFTYQGELSDAGSPANGDYDFEFKLFDADPGGSQVGANLTADDINVTNGRFTVVLQPSVSFTGSRTFLEIAVRPGASGGAYTTLTPRQELTAAPYALGLPPNTEIRDPDLTAGWLLSLLGETGSNATGLQVQTESGVGVQATSTNAKAILGVYSGTGLSPGVQGQSSSASALASGVAGGMTTVGADATSAGVLGINEGAGMGVFGEHQSSTGTAPGVVGITQSISNDAAGVLGEIAPTAPGSFSSGVRGVNNSTTSKGIGVYGSQAGSGWGVYGAAPSGRGVYGSSDSGTGVFARSSSGNLIEGWDQFDPKFRVDNNGNVTADGTYTSPAADFAELLPATGDVEPGDVLVIDIDGSLTCSERAYDSAVVGVHSTRPAFLGGANGENMESKIPLAVVGVVPVKVTNENGPITPGDLLVASGTIGHAMRAGDDPPNGTVIGKALEPASDRSTVINAILMLQ